MNSTPQGKAEIKIGALIHSGGFIYYDGNLVHHDSGGVRPALRLKFSNFETISPQMGFIRDMKWVFRSKMEAQKLAVAILFLLKRSCEV